MGLGPISYEACMGNRELWSQEVPPHRVRRMRYPKPVVPQSYSGGEGGSGEV